VLKFLTPTFTMIHAFFEWRPRLDSLLDVVSSSRSAIQYGDTANDTIIYRAVNGHECRDGEPYPEFYLWKVDLATGADTWSD
jgi:hypothetical protein